MRKRRSGMKRSTESLVGQIVPVRVRTPIAIVFLTLAVSLIGYGIYFVITATQQANGPLIENGDFSTGDLTSWTTYIQDPAGTGNTISVVDEGIGSQGPMLKMDTQKLLDPSYNWQVQATQTNAQLGSLTPSTIYELSFVAKASTPRSINFDLHQTSPYAQLGFSYPNFEIGTTLATYTYRFQTFPTIPSGQIDFGIYTGSELGTVWIDDIAINPVTAITYTGYPLTISGFEPDQTWIRGSLDFTHVRTGTSGVTISANANEGEYAALNGLYDFSASNWMLSLWVYTDTPQNVGRMFIELHSGSTKSKDQDFLSWSGLQAGWNHILIPKSAFVEYYWAGRLNWSRVGSILIKLESNNNGPSSVTLDDLAIMPLSQTDDLPPAVKLLNAVDITNNSAKITWKLTELGASSTIDCGTSLAYGTTVTGATEDQRSYQATLTGLQPNQLYHCAITATDIAGNVGHTGDFTFVTKRSTPLVEPNGSAPYEFGEWVVGAYDDVVRGDFYALDQVGQTDITHVNVYYLSNCSGQDAQTKGWLDRAESYGKKVTMFFCNQKFLPGQLDLTYIQDRVNLYKNHPALSGWIFYDEPDLAPYDQDLLSSNLKTAYQLLKSLDPVHPVFGALAFGGHLAKYIGSFDYLGGDTYPVPYNPVSAILPNIQSLRDSGYPFVFSFQTYTTEIQQWPLNLGRPGWYPSYDQMRTMAYTAIAYGAKGVWNYGYQYFPDSIGSDWHWTDVTRLASEIHELSPILVSTISSPTQVSSVSDANIQTGFRVANGKTYLLTTSMSPDPVTATVTLNDTTSYSGSDELFTGSHVAISSGSFSDTWPAYGVRIYPLQLADVTAPAAPASVFDGAGSDESFSNDKTQLAANWTAVTDVESGLDHYEIAIGTSSGGTEVQAFTPTGTDTSKTFALLDLADDAYYISVRAIDGSGNVGAAKSSNGITIDTTKPTTAITAPLNGSAVAANNVPLTLDANDSSGIQQLSVAIDGSDVSSVAVTEPYSADLDISGYADGTHTLTVEATDNAGNTNISAPIKITVDRTAPTAPPAVRRGSSGDEAYTTDNTSASANWDLATDATTGVAGYEIALGTSAGATNVLGYTNAGLTNTYNKNGLLLADGSYYWSVRAVDNAGNVGSSTSSSSFIVDTTAPAKPGAVRRGLTGDQPYTTSSTTLSANWNAANDSGSGIGHYDFAVGSSAGASDVLAFTNVGNTLFASVSSLSLADGYYYLSIRGIDAAGNVGSQQVSAAYLVDHTPPTASISQPLNGQEVAGSVTVQVGGGDTVGIQRVSVAIDGSEKNSTASPNLLYTWDTTTFTNGSHSIQVQVTDLANQTTSRSITVSVNNAAEVPIDAQAPSVGILTPSQNQTISGTVTLSASVSDNVAVALVRFFANSSLIGQLTSGPYSATWNSASVSDGLQTLTVEAKDSSGNVNTSTIQVNVKNTLSSSLDRTAPTVSFVKPDAGAILDGEVEWEATASDNVTVREVQFYVDGVLMQIATASPYRVTLPTRQYATGFHRLSLISIDTSGNTSPVAYEDVNFQILSLAERLRLANIGITPDPALIKRLSGRILIQVERNGEAWYLNPADGRRYFMGRPTDAFAMMRGFGLGISDTDLTKLPRWGYDETGDEALVSRLLGRIVLQVEKNGEAWYIYPPSRRRNYMGRPTDAFALMRLLGLGISNTDLRKIPIGLIE